MSCKTPLILLVLLFVTKCASECGIKVPIRPVLDKGLREIEPIPMHIALFIDPSLRQWTQEERQTSMIAGVHHYIFPIGTSLAKNIEETTQKVFNEVTVLNELPGLEKVEANAYDAVLTVQLVESTLELIVEDSVCQAIGKHHLSIRATFSDKQFNTLFDENLTVEGKHLDIVDFETEGGWWKTAGPKYGPAVEDSIEKVVSNLAQKLLASGKQIEN